ncbi:DUF4097 family beta strand repeat-containing protein [Sporosarcina siberiensis]|uniref:DUF4097 family beta strand repeat-containing protein n=1 Tax=Sporosarcina siberiensis TaxID=1365606 RepID=A0ABW4SAX8_9BACL
MQKNNNNSRLIALLVGVALILLFVWILPFNSSNKDYIKTISADFITNIHINANLGDIHILPIEGNELTVRMESESKKKIKGYKLSLKEKNNRVTINAKKKSKFGLSGKLPFDFKLIVEVPVKQYDLLKVNSNVSTIYVDSITANKFELQTNVGHIHLNTTTGFIYAETNVGDINMQLNTILNDIIAETQVGNVSVKIAEVPASLQTDLKNSIGNTMESLPNMQNGSIGVGGPIVKLTSEVGNIELTLMDH